MKTSGAVTANPPGEPILQCQQVSLVYGAGWTLLGSGSPFTAVDEVSLEVNRGEVLAIVGESGSGKTTLSRMMFGALSPTRGTVLLEGEDIASIPRKQLARRVQPVFQNPHSSLNPRRCVRDILLDPLVIHGVGDRAEREQWVSEAVDHVGLPGRLLGAYPNQLSGGQCQRVSIARALIMRPEIIICDEPTSALDVSMQAQILNLLKDLQAELRLAMVIVTHNLDVAAYMATGIAVMNCGQVVESGATQTLLQQPRVEYTRSLLASVLTPDPSLGLPPAH
ncbi:ABC transporter ATP-binding protein [Mesorhizobium sp. 1B3]|uniref:ABC transporter ATP-binding protein n=1 Tax=Mesorhizobium sp. 1B3 TaxID=3243599 RepID=UPI003D99C789